MSFTVFLNISVLRYLSIIQPFLRIETGHQRTVLLIELICATSICIGYVFMLQDVTIKTNPLTQLVFGTVFIIMIGAVLTINILSYKAMPKGEKILARRSKKTNDIEIKPNCFGQVSNKNKRSAVVTLIIVTIYYLICNLPITIFAFISAMELDFGNLQNLLISSIMQYIQLTNTGLNPTIYILRSRELREFYKSKLTDFKC